MEKEYGGYLPIELSNNSEYYNSKNVMRFNCARSAIKYVLIQYDYSCIYLPVYMCESVRDAIKMLGVEIKYYNIGENFEPLINKIEPKAVILIANYYGIREENSNYILKFKNVIYDNTQAFFAKPIEGAYNIYSCRKFFGVCDGAYLVCDKLKESELPDYYPLYADYLFKSINEGSNSAYSLNLNNEGQISESGLCSMSRFSQKVLQSIDYELVKEKRKNNFYYLNSKLNYLNKLKLCCSEDKVPMIYPLLYVDKDIRKQMVQEKIYIPQWWEYILWEEKSNGFEKDLSKYLLPLPIDQRYEINDMEEIVNKILKIIEV